MRAGAKLKAIPPVIPDVHAGIYSPIRSLKLTTCRLVGLSLLAEIVSGQMCIEIAKIVLPA